MGNHKDAERLKTKQLALTKRFTRGLDLAAKAAVEGCPFGTALLAYADAELTETQSDRDQYAKDKSKRRLPELDASPIFNDGRLN